MVSIIISSSCLYFLTEFWSRLISATNCHFEILRNSRSYIKHCRVSTIVPVQLLMSWYVACKWLLLLLKNDFEVVQVNFWVIWGALLIMTMKVMSADRLLTRTYWECKHGRESGVENGNFFRSDRVLKQTLTTRGLFVRHHFGHMVSNRKKTKQFCDKLLPNQNVYTSSPITDLQQVPMCIKKKLHFEFESNGQITFSVNVS